MVHDVLQVMEILTLHGLAELPTFFYGHSAGGAVAAAVAFHIVEGVGDSVYGAVGGVLLEDPFWRLPVTPLQDRAVAEQAYLDLLEAQALAPEQRFLLKKGEWPGWEDDEVQRACEAQLNADPQVVRNGNVIPSQPWPEILRDLGAADVPVLIITGTHRTGITPSHQWIAESQGARVEVFDGASHFVRRDATQRFMESATAFLEECLSVHHPSL
jgi:pimeloyl-ACP methyl ester carboxylesterase